jgi:hypothetical protein
MASLTLDWLHIIVLLGAVQGVFLAGALATKRRNRTANRLLAATMLAFSIGLASTVYHAGYVGLLPHFFGWSYPLPFLYGPLVYLYALCAADRNRRLTRLDALHLVPFLATVTAGLPIYLMSGAEKAAFFHLLQSGGTPPLLILIADPLKFVSGITYTALTISFLRRHRERVKESYSSTERVNLRWLLWLGAAAAAIWMLAVAFEVMESTGIALVARSDDFVSLAIAALVYGIGYRGMRQPEICYEFLRVVTHPRVLRRPWSGRAANESSRPSPLRRGSGCWSRPTGTATYSTRWWKRCRTSPATAGTTWIFTGCPSSRPWIQ